MLTGRYFNSPLHTSLSIFFIKNINFTYNRPINKSFITLYSGGKSQKGYDENTSLFHTVSLKITPEPHKEKQTLYANDLFIRYIKGLGNRGFYALKELRGLTEKYPKNTQTRSIYLNILLLEKSTHRV